MNKNECKAEGKLTPIQGLVYQGSKLVFPSVRPELIERSLVYRPRHTLFDYCCWPSVCSDENGVLYATSSAFRMEHVCPFSKIAMYISKDRGKTWSVPMIVVDSCLEDGFAGGGLVYLGNGKILLSWCSKPAVDEYNEFYYRLKDQKYTYRIPGPLGLIRAAMVDYYPNLPEEELLGGAYVKLSEDYGMTWSDPVRVPVQNVHGATLRKNGEIVMLGKEYFPDDTATREWIGSGFSAEGRFIADDPADYSRRLLESVLAKEHFNRPIRLIASGDGGKTWESRGTVPVIPGLDPAKMVEPHCVELEDGSLLGTVRVEDLVTGENEFTVYTTRSTDGGMTWTPCVCTHLAGSPPHIMKHSSGALILTIGRRAGSPLGQFAAVSFDNGETWCREYAIDDTAPNSDLGYPCTTELPDGSLVTVYYQVYVDPVTGQKDRRPCIQSTHWTL